MTNTTNSLEKFLQGKANEQETRHSEALLQRQETVPLPQLETNADHDSLLEALQVARETWPDSDAATIQKLTEQLHQLIPRPEISSDEIRKLFDPTEHPEALGQIGKFQIIEYLASGGMGLVFRAIDPDFQRQVCLKLLHPARGERFEARTRFERETRLIARLHGERIMPILDIGVHRELPFLVMPLLEGASLRTVLSRDGKLPVRRAIKIATQIAEGLEFAQQLEILHRDIKPDNLWITPSDDVKLLDFGLARDGDEAAPITHAGTVLGTPSYMSPEQITGKSVDGRSDLFSLGVVLVEMLTGQSPFRKDNLFSTLMSVASDEVDLGSLDSEQTIPAPLRELIERLLQKSPAGRPASATEVVASLRAIDISSLESPSSPSLRPQTVGSGRSRWLTAIAAACGGFFVCLAAIALWQLNDKGTLVVETSDSRVEVRIVGEEVVVRDPLTDRTYAIRIGKTPLPSGVYQLEFADQVSDLVFSSETIAIRRGEQTIVKVQLRPPQASLAQEAAAVVPTAPQVAEVIAQPNPTFVPPLVPVDRGEIVDASFDPAARERFAEILGQLPAMSLADFFPKERLSHAATVPNPQAISGIDTWSLEVPEVKPENAEWNKNADQTLFATGRDQVWVYDAKGIPRYMLPTPGPLLRFAFDDHHPNLIAVCSWVGEPKVGGVYEPGEDRRYRIDIWRLDLDGAKLIQTFASTSYLMVWDKGYRLIYIAKGKIVASRLDTGATIVLFDRIEERLAKISVSPSGRFLVISLTGENAATNLVDLHRGQFVSSIRVGGTVQWQVDDAAVAVFSRDKSFVEIWRPDRPEMLKRVELVHPEQSDRRRTRVDRSSPVLSGDFTRIARIDDAGELKVQSLLTQVEASTRAEGLRLLNQPKLTWNGDGSLSVDGEDAAFLWRRTDSEVDGVLSIATPRPVPPKRNAVQFEGPIVGLRGEKLFLQVPDSSSRGGLGAGGGGGRESTTDAALSFVNLNDLVSGSEFSRSGKSVAARNLQYLSPNGKWLIVSRPNRLRADIFSDLELFSLEEGRSIPLAEAVVEGGMVGLGGGASSDGNIVTNIPAFREGVSTFWSHDSRYLLVVGVNLGQPFFGARPKIAKFIRVWDAHTETEVLFDNSDGLSLFSPPASSKVSIAPDGFLVQTGSASKFELYLLEPTTSKVTSIELANEQQEWKLDQATGEFFVFIESLGVDQLVHRRVRVTEGKLIEAGTITAHQRDRVFLSPDGEHFCLLTYDPQSISSHQSGRSTTYSVADLDKYPATLVVKRWSAPNEKPLATWKSSEHATDIVWHSSGKSLAVRDSQSRHLHFLDLTTGNWRTLFEANDDSRTNTLHPTETGWLQATSDHLMFLKSDGEFEFLWLLGAVTPQDGSTDPLATGVLVRNLGFLQDVFPDQLRVVYRKENRISVEDIRTFEGPPQNYSIPRFQRTVQPH